jgi:hypothetical protein
MQKIVLLFTFLLCCFYRQAATAQSMKMPANIDSLPKGYLCFYADGKLKIDGKLDDKAWANAPWTDDFTDIQGDLQPKPRFRTRVKMLWDDSCFYIGAELEEPNVWATLKKRDTVIFYDNDFEVFIDPNGDNHEYYEFEMNALNTVWDLFLPRPYRAGGPAMNAWDIRGLKTAVKVHGTINRPGDIDTGWTVEIAMPWKALGEFAHRPAPPADGDQWRINFSRVEWQIETGTDRERKIPGTPEDNWVWSPQWTVDMHQPELWGYLQFSAAGEGIVPFRNDSLWSARMALYRVYRAEKSFYAGQRRYSTDFGSLGIATGWQDVVPSIRLQGDGYEAVVRKAGTTLHMDQSSRVR